MNFFTKRNTQVVILLISLIFLSLTNLSYAGVQRIKHQTNNSYVIVECLRDDLIHFEYGHQKGPDAAFPIRTSPMVCDPSDADNKTSQVCKSDHNGASFYRTREQADRSIIETKDLIIEVHENDLSIDIIDKTKGDISLTQISPINLSQRWKGLRATRKRESSFLGLGQKFTEEMKYDSTFNWNGRVRDSGPYGNKMEYFNGGMNSNTQIPILYVLNDTPFENYAFFLDNIYKQRWNFTDNNNWQVEMIGDEIRFFFISGPDIPDLRKDFLEIVGRPLVPPKKMFGLWVSEYSYQNWPHVEDKLRTLRQHSFPVDGFLLDSYWFGGLNGCSDYTRMGALSWDLSRFPTPSQKLYDFKNNEGIGIMLIEEPYVGRSLPEHSELQARGCLVKKCPDCSEPEYYEEPCWWGRGGMIDYTNESCGDFIHNNKRQELIEDGIVGHWLDLGEPEIYKETSSYAGGSHENVHNLYNFNWIQAISRGYFQYRLQQRPFILTRSGTAGIQRFGSAVWSGDTACRMGSLVAQFANQANMSLSGIDYYGSDIGGYRRETLDGDMNELYTQWYAYGMLFEVPGRPHTDNYLCSTIGKCAETAPDRVGHLPSNLDNTRLRYQLSPYYYSLAHRAYLYGEPVMPPLIYYYQADPNVRTMGHQKLIGKNLLAALIANYGEKQRQVYLPAGVWFDYHTNRPFKSKGEWIGPISAYRNGKFTLPLFAAKGSIIPVAHIDDATMNIMGKRADNKEKNIIGIKIFASEKESSFTLYEDDGESIAYQSGAVRVTEIRQKQIENAVKVTLSAAIGDYHGASYDQNVSVQLISERAVANVALNGRRLKKHSDIDSFEKSSSGWIELSDKTALAKSGVTRVTTEKEFIFTLGDLIF